MEELTEEQKFLRANTKVDRLRGFYIHVIVYICVNAFLTAIKLVRNFENGETLNEAVFDFGTIVVWLFWGVGIAFHAFSVYGFDYFLGRNWEEERLRKFMEEEEGNLKQHN